MVECYCNQMTGSKMVEWYCNQMTGSRMVECWYTVPGEHPVGLQVPLEGLPSQLDSQLPVLLRHRLQSCLF